MLLSSKNHWQYFFIIVLSLFICYLPALVGSYVHHDDVYFWLRDNQSFSQHPMSHLMFAMGRFLGAYLVTAQGFLVTKVVDLNLIRLLSILQISLSAWIIFLFLSKQNESKLKAYLICMLIFTLPPFQIMAAYAAIAFLSTSILLSTLAAYLTLQTPIDSSLTKRLLNKQLLLSILLLISSYSIYSSTAPFYWIFVILSLFALPKDKSYAEIKQSMWNLFYVGLSATAGYALILKLSKGLLLKATRGMHNPYVMTTDYYQKILWFFKEPLVNALNFWNIHPNNSLTLLSLFFILCPLLAVLFFAGKKDKGEEGGRLLVRPPMFKFFIICLTLILSFLPNLINIGYVAYYRCLAGLMSCIVILFIWSLQKWLQLLPSSTRDKIFIPCLILICLYGGFKAFTNISNFIVRPNHFELEITKNILDRSDLNKFKKIHILHPELNNLRQRYDEFGNFTTQYLNNTKLFIKCALREIKREGGLDLEKLRYAISPPLDNYFFKSSTLVIDLTKTLNPNGPFDYLFRENKAK